MEQGGVSSCCCPGAWQQAARCQVGHPIPAARLANMNCSCPAIAAAPPHLLVAGLVPGLAKHDVLLEGQVLAPRGLGHVGDLAAGGAGALHGLHVAQQRLEQGGRRERR